MKPQASQEGGTTKLNYKGDSVNLSQYLDVDLAQNISYI